MPIAKVYKSDHMAVGVCVPAVGNTREFQQPHMIDHNARLSLRTQHLRAALDDLRQGFDVLLHAIATNPAFDKPDVREAHRLACALRDSALHHISESEREG